MSDSDDPGMTPDQPEKPGPTPGPTPAPVSRALDDAGTRALSEALRSSFGIIKLVMLGLVVVFLLSGFRTVGTQEKAVKLRFGKPVGSGEGALLESGLHWALPYPIDEVVTIPVSEVQTVRSTVGWYETSALMEAAGNEPPPEESLDPARDGYLLTGDGNIIHGRGTLRYRVRDPLVYVFDFVTSSNSVQQAFDSALVYAAAQFSVDDVLTRDPAGFRETVQRRLDQLIGLQELGIIVDNIAITTIPPRQLSKDFDAVLEEEQKRSKELNEARSYSSERVNQAKGEAAALVSMSETERTRRVEFVAADATNFLALLPAYERDPSLFLHQQHAQMMSRILTNAETKLLLADGPSQLRLLLQRERKRTGPELAPKQGGHEDEH